MSPRLAKTRHDARPHALSKCLLALAALFLVGWPTASRAVNSVTLSDFVTGGAGTASDPYYWSDDAVSAAQNALGSSGGIIAVPSGYYMNRGEIRLNGNIALVGAGMDASYFLKTGTSSQWLVVLSSASNCSISKITFDGYRAQRGDVNWGTLLLRMSSGSNILVDRCKFQQTYGSAIYFGSNLSNVTVQYCQFDSNDRSLWQHNEHNYRNITAKNNSFYGPIGSQYAISSFDDPLVLPIAPDMNLLFEYNQCENWKYGFCFAKSANVRVRNNIFSGAAWNAGWNQCVHMEDSTNDVIVDHNQFNVTSNIGGQCITVQHTSNVTISNNLLNMPTGECIKGETTTNTQILNNIFQSGNIAVDIWSSSLKTAIQGNWIQASANWDVLLSGSQNSIIDNIFPAAPKFKNVPADTVISGTRTYDQYVADFGAPPANWSPIVFPPAISGSDSAVVTVGSAFSFPITASNAPTSFNASGLPPGLSLAASTGVISGTPTAAGTWIANLSASNAQGSGTQNCIVTIVRPNLWRGSSNGSWDTSTLNWSSSDSRFLSLDDAVFDDSALRASVTATGTVQPRNLTFANNALAYNVSGSVAPTGAISKSGSAAVTISGNISGMGGVTVNNGQLTLSGTNSYPGLTSVNSGTLAVLANNTGSGPYRVNGGTLEVEGAISGAGRVTVNRGGVLSGAGTLAGWITVESGGALTPGDSGGNGDMNLTGGCSLSAGAILNFQIGAGTGSEIALSGSYVAPTSGTVTVNIAGASGFWPGIYPLITGAAGIDVSQYVLGTVPVGDYSFALVASGSALSLVVTGIPPAPSGVICYDSNGKLVLDWAPSSMATQYQIYRSGTSGSGFASLGTTSATEYVDPTVTAGATYYYHVTASNICGESGPSAEVSALVYATSGTFSWSSSPSSSNWSLGANWGGTVPLNDAQIVFGSSTKTSLTNDISNFALGGLAFNPGASAYAVGGNSAILAGDITDNATSSETISCNLTLNGTRTVCVNAGTLSLSGTLSDGGIGYGLVKTGSGSLTLSAPNSFDGGIAIESGTVTLGHASASGPGAILLGDPNPGATSSASLFGSFNSGVNSSPITLGATSGAITLGNSGGNNPTFIGNVALNGHDLILVANGAGDLNWTGTNGSGITGTGNLIFKSSSSGGFNIINTSGAAGLNFSGTLLNQGTGTGVVFIKYSVGANVAQIIQDSATSSMTLYGAMANYPGPYLIRNGTLQAHNGALGPGTVTLGDVGTRAGGASFQVNSVSVTNPIVVSSSAGATSLSLRLNSASSQSFSGPIALNNDLILAGFPGGTLSISGAITGSNNLTISGSGPVVLSANDTAFTGNVLVSTGTLKAGAATAFNAANQVSFANGSCLDLNGKSVTIEGLIDASPGGGTGGLVTQSATAGATLTLAGSGTYSYSGAIANSGSALAVTVALAPGGTQTLSGPISYAGPTSITGGSLILLGTSSGQGMYTINGGAFLDVSGLLGNANASVTVASGGTLVGSGTIAGSVSVAGGGTISPGGASPGTLSIGGAFTLGAKSALTLGVGFTSDQIAITGTGAFTGGSSPAVLNIVGLAGFGPGTYTLISGATGISASNFLLGSVPSGYACALSANAGSLLLTVRAAAAFSWSAIPSSGVWSNAANWGGTRPQDGDLIAFGASSITGLTNDLSSIALGGITFNSGASAFTLSGSAIYLNGSIVNSSTTAQTINLNLILTGSVSVLANPGNLLLGGGISDAGLRFGLVKSGAGTLTLTGSNTFAGGVTLNSGTLALGTDGTGNENQSSLGSGLLALNGGSLRFGGLSGAVVANTSKYFANPILFNGGGIDAFDGINHFQGSFTVSGTAGNLVRSNFSNKPTLIDGMMTGTGSMAVGGAFSGNGSGGSLTITNVTGSNNFAGTITVNPGGALVLSATGSNPDNAGSALAMGSVVNNSNGNGSLVSSGVGFDTGVTVAIFGSLAGSGQLLLENFDGNGVDLTVGANNLGTTYSGAISGDEGSLTKTGSGTFILSGNNDFMGATSVEGGTLAIAGTNGGGGAIAVASGATLQVTGCVLNSAVMEVGEGAALTGSGTIAAPVTLDVGGTIAPGNGSGFANLHLSGGLQLNAGSVLAMDLGSASGSDQIALAGAYVAPSDGVTTININPLAGFGPGTYSLITGAAGISEQSFVIGSKPAGYGFQIVASGDTLSLVVALLPPAPTGLSIYGANGLVGLSWSPSLTGTGYNVYRATTSGSGYSLLASVPSPSFADNAVVNGTAYFYKITALNSVGEGSFSMEVSATPGPFTWIAAPGSANWSLGASWGGLAPVNNALLTFGVSTTTSLNNDLANLAVGGLVFNSGASAFTLSGSSLTLAGNIADSASATQAIRLNLALNGNRLVVVDSGTLSITGTISDAGAGYGLVKSGVGNLLLSASNNFSGGLFINSGTVFLSHASAAGTGGPIFLGDTAAGASASAALFASFSSGSNSNLISLGTTTGALALGNTSANSPTFTGSMALNGHDLWLLTGSSGALNWSGSSGGSISGTGNLIFKASGSGGLNITNSGSTAALNFSGTLLNQGTGTGSVFIKYTVGKNLTQIVQDSPSSTLTLYGSMASYAGPYLIRNGNLQAQNGALGGGLVTLGDAGTGPGGAAFLINGVSVPSQILVSEAAGSNPLSLRLNSATAQSFYGPITLNNDLVLTTGNLAGAALTISGGIAGAGNLTVTGSGTVLLGGNNAAFAGDVLVATGTLKASSSAALGIGNKVFIANGAAFDLNGKSLSLEGLSDAASGPGGLLTQSATTATTLTLGGTASYSFSGAITQSGSALSLSVALAPGAIQTLSGSNSYNGPTTVSGGTLIVAGTNLGAGACLVSNGGALLVAGKLINSSLLSVASGGTLAGSGTIAAPVTVSSGGSLAPGNGGPGILSVIGTLTLNASSSLNLNLGASSSTDQIALSGSYVGPVGGTVVLNINALPGFGPGVYTLITGALGVSPSHFSFGSMPAGYTYDLQASAQSLTLTVVAAAWQTWLSSSFGANWPQNGLAAPSAAPNGDGIANLAAYALGASTPGSSALPLMPKTAVSSGRLALSFDRLPARSDITVTVLASDSLAGPWESAATSSAGGVFAPATDYQVIETGTGLSRHIEIRDRYLLSDPSHPRRFMRLNITMP